MEIAEWIAPFKTIAAIGDIYKDADLSTALEEQSYQPEIKIYPNPTNSKTWIKYDSKAEMTLKIRAVNGDIVHKNKLPKGISNFPIDLTEAASGLYYLEVKVEDALYFYKIEKIE